MVNVEMAQRSLVSVYVHCCQTTYPVDNGKSIGYPPKKEI